MHMADQARALTPDSVTQLLSHCSDPEEVLGVIHAVSNLHDTSGADGRRKYPLVRSAVAPQHEKFLLSLVAGAEPPPTRITAHRMSLVKLQEFARRAGVPTGAPIASMGKADLVQHLTSPRVHRALMARTSEAVPRAGEQPLHPEVREVWMENLRSAVESYPLMKKFRWE